MTEHRFCNETNFPSFLNPLAKIESLDYEALTNKGPNKIVQKLYGKALLPYFGLGEL